MTAALSLVQVKSSSETIQGTRFCLAISRRCVGALGSKHIAVICKVAHSNKIGTKQGMQATQRLSNPALVQNNKAPFTWSFVNSDCNLISLCRTRHTAFDNAEGAHFGGGCLMLLEQRVIYDFCSSLADFYRALKMMLTIPRSTIFDGLGSYRPRTNL